MLFPQIISLGLVQIPTLYFFGFFGFVLGLFLIWFEGKKDGFDRDKLFDLLFLILLSWGLLAFVTYRYLLYFHKLYKLDFAQFASFLFILIFMLTIFIYTKNNSWSIFRILDIFSLSVLLTLSSIFLGIIIVLEEKPFLSYFLVSSIIFVLLHLFRKVFLSGVTFLLVVLTIGLFSYFLGHLIFSIPVVTIGLLVLFFRFRIKAGPTVRIFIRKKMLTRNLSEEFIQKQKSILLSKRATVLDEISQLKQSDPYLDSGRDVDNSSIVDDALLEDEAKVQLDLQIANLEKILSQIDKALSKIESGDYGICEITGEPIDMARLEAYPEATTSYDVARHDDEL